MFLFIKGQGSRAIGLGVCFTMLLVTFVIPEVYAGDHVQHQVSIEGFEFVPKTLHVMPRSLSDFPVE